MTRQAISPRFAIRIFLNMALFLQMPGPGRRNRKGRTGTHPDRPMTKIQCALAAASAVFACNSTDDAADQSRFGQIVISERAQSCATNSACARAGCRGACAHAARQRRAEKSEKDKSFPHVQLPRLLVVLRKDSTATSAEAN